MSAILTCAQCGGGLGPNDRFCGLCGAELLPGLASLPPGDPESVLADIVQRLRRATLGEFEIGRELGRGGMAAVFLAHEISLDRKVAIKVMAPGLLLGDGMVERFRHEAITIAQLHHPNIVSVYSVRQAEGLHFFVMRYVEGRSLEQVLERAGRLPIPVVRSILHQVGAALTYAHRSRIIHRDVKPANILLDLEGNAVVTDFGIAKVAESPSQTITGALVGTPAYMSPEQCSGAEVSGASDQYALGAVAYEMLTGVAPFLGSTLTVMQAHVERSPLPIREHCPDCPPEFEAAILRMLAKDPAERWPRIPEALAALGAAPLAEDDPLRAEIRLLVADSGGSSLTGSPTPTSPAPLTHPSSGRGQLRSRAVGAISILPPPTALEVGDSFVLVAMVRGRHGTRLPPSSVVWSSEPPGLLRFDSGGGVAVAMESGTTLLTATSGEGEAHLRIEIVPPRADEITIDPIDHGIAVGDEIRLDALARDKRGQPIPRSVTWRSADPSIATVTPEGALVARAEGFTQVTAVLDDAVASLTIPVLPARVASIHIGGPTKAVVGAGTFRVTGTPVDRWGAPLAGRPVLWSSSDVRVAVVTVGGTVHALRPGSVVLTASCEGVSESVRVGIEAETAPAPPAAPTAPTAPPGVPLTNRRRSRRSRRGRTVASVLGAGLMGGALWLVSQRPEQPTDSGAVPDRLQAADQVDTTAPGPARDSLPELSLVITRQPGRALQPASSSRLAAELRGEDGRVIPDSGIGWSSSDSSVVRVNSSTGWVRAVRPGAAVIFATSGERRDSVTITVRAAKPEVPAVASVSIAARDPLYVGDTATLEAIVLDGKGVRSAGAAVVWQSSNLSVVEIDPRTGRVRANKPGTALVIARSGGESALAEVTVLPTPVARINVGGAHPLLVGETLGLWAEATDAGGERLRDRPLSWTSSNRKVATVDSATGLVTARSPGSAVIIVSSEGKSARVRLLVAPRSAAARDEEATGEREAAAADLLAGVAQCYEALRSRDVARLAKMYHAETDADRDKLSKLSRILRTEEWSATVGERINGERRIGGEAAAMEFSFLLTWKDAFGGRLSSEPVFRADFTRDGDRWRMSSCRIVGSPRL